MNKIRTPNIELYDRPRLAGDKGFTDRLGALGPEDINDVYMLDGNEDVHFLLRMYEPPILGML